MELLPSKEVQSKFKKTWAVLISRVICKYLSSFKQYRSLVIHHIPHQFSKEMAQKSKSCCLDLLFKNPNIAGEMAEIMAFNQQKYVPCLSSDGKKEVLIPIALHGDQLFEERARNVQWTFRDGDTRFDQLKHCTRCSLNYS